MLCNDIRALFDVSLVVVLSCVEEIPPFGLVCPSVDILDMRIMNNLKI